MKKTRNIYLILLVFISLCLTAGLAQAKLPGELFPPASQFQHPKDNPLLARKPDSTYTFKLDKKDKIITNEITITHNILFFQGIRCSIVKDVEWTYVKRLNEKFKTAEIYKFYAWDNKGNVWNFGQDEFKYLYNNSWRYKGLSTKDSWLAGKNHAFPKIVIPVNSKPGLRYEYLVNNS